MKVHPILFLSLLFLFGCFTPHGFNDSQTKIVPKTSLNSDSVEYYKPIVLGYWKTGAEEFQIDIFALDRRRDSIFRLYSNFLFRNSFSSVDGNISFGCFDTVFNKRRTFWDENIDTQTGQERRFILDSVSVFQCIKPKETSFNVITLFRLRVSEMGYDYDFTFDNLYCSVIILKERRIVYYRNYVSRIRSEKKHFAKGSLDRANYPHFPQWQLEKVVKAVVEDLRKYIQ